METSTSRRVTLEQKSALIQYLEEHRDFAHDRFCNESGNKSLSEQWTALASNLNALGGANKNGEGWKRAWVNMRSKTKQKAQELKGLMEQSGINGHIPSKNKLSELDERVIGVITKIAVFGQDDVAEPLRSCGEVNTVVILDDDECSLIVVNDEDFTAPSTSKRQRPTAQKRSFTGHSVENKFLEIAERTLKLNERTVEQTDEIIKIKRNRQIIEEKRLKIEERRLEIEEERLQYEKGTITINGI